MCCISIFGQTANNISLNNAQAVTLNIETLEPKTQEQDSDLKNRNHTLSIQVSNLKKENLSLNIQVSNLQKENQALNERMSNLEKGNDYFNEQLLKMESEIALYREDVRNETSRMNENMSDWLEVLAIIVTILSVVPPIIINVWNNNRQKEKLDEINNKVDKANRDAMSAKRALVAVGKLKNEITHIKQTIEASEKAAKKSADEAMASKLFAEALAEHKNNPQRAIELYTKIMELGESNAGVYNNRGALRFKLGDIDGAMADYNKAVELDPNDFKTYHNRALLRKKIGDFHGEIKDYEKAIRLHPNATDNNNLADIYKELGNTDKALEYANIAISLDENDYICHITKGEILMTIHKYTDAIEEFTHSISLKDGVKEAYINRAQCYRALADESQDIEKKNEYIALAEADEKECEELTKKTHD